MRWGDWSHHRRDAPPPQAGLLAVKAISQQFAGLEEGNLLVIDLHGLARSRIAPDTRITRFHREGPEAAQLYPVALGKRFNYLFEHRIYDTLDMALRKVRILIRDLLNKF
jgi:hypothetical protein